MRPTKVLTAAYCSCGIQCVVVRSACAIPADARIKVDSDFVLETIDLPSCSADDFDCLQIHHNSSEFIQIQTDGSLQLEDVRGAGIILWGAHLCSSAPFSFRSLLFQCVQIVSDAQGLQFATTYLSTSWQFLADSV